MEREQLSAGQKLKMKNFTDFINFGNDLRFSYINMLERNYRQLLNEQKQQITCEHCGTTVIGKAYGPHVKKFHPETVKSKKNRNIFL